MKKLLALLRQHNDATQVSDEVPATVAETTAEVTYEEKKTTLSAEVDPSGENTEESEANENSRTGRNNRNCHTGSRGGDKRRGRNRG